MFYSCESLVSVGLGSNVASIGERAFYECVSLTNITFPDNLTTIGHEAFAYSGLTHLRLGTGVTSIGVGSFAACLSLTKINFSDSGRSIGGAAFSSCTNLTSITMPSGIATIHYRAFSGCNLLRRVYFQGNAPGVGSDVFLGSPAAIYYLPGTSGWYSPFGGASAVLWNPRVLTDDGNLGVQAGQFGFTIEGAADIPVAVEACDNLANPNWTTVANLTFNAEGTGQFIDPDAANKPTRSYRFRAE